jgi:ATPase subunit of ABC transporter with duplicated ATPase domains
LSRGHEHASEGDKIRLVGPNGAGKTTLFRMIAGEELPGEGQVSIDRGITIGYFNQDVGEMAGHSAWPGSWRVRHRDRRQAQPAPHGLAQADAAGVPLMARSAVIRNGHRAPLRLHSVTSIMSDRNIIRQ